MTGVTFSTTWSSRRVAVAAAVVWLAAHVLVLLAGYAWWAQTHYHSQLCAEQYVGEAMLEWGLACAAGDSVIIGWLVYRAVTPRG